LLFAGQFIGAAGSTAEPAFDGSAQEIATFLGSLRGDLMAAGTLIVLLGVVALLTFAAGLHDVLGTGAGSLSVLAVRTAQLCAIGFVVAVGSGGWELGVLRRSDLDPQIARLIFDQAALRSPSPGCCSAASPSALVLPWSPAGRYPYGWAGGRSLPARGWWSPGPCGCRSSGFCRTCCCGCGSW
jgi:hypothetical protein